MQISKQKLEMDAAWKQAYRALSYLAQTRDYEAYQASAKVLGDSIRAIRAEMETL